MQQGEVITTRSTDEPRQPGDDAAPRGRRRRRERVRWNLLGCAFHDHELIGTDVGVISPTDEDLVRPAGTGRRWHRCLRCDAWIDQPVPLTPTRETCPRGDEIEMPLRDRALRDRYILKLIALERLLHVVFFLVVGLVLLFVARDRDTLDADFLRIVADMQAGGTARSGTGAVAEVGKFFTFSYSSLYLLAAVALVYAAFEGVEAIGLWRGRRWAEYMTFIATALLLPLEAYGIIDRPSPLNVMTFAVNLAIVIYLVVSKRLFGFHQRGGQVEVG